MILIFFLLWCVNFIISIFNAWGCGKTWNETKHVGGFAHFINWMAAVMSASGFTWCYLVILGIAGTVIPIEQSDHTYAPILAGQSLQAFASLGYLVLVFPVLGSGLAITIHSWGYFWRKRNFGSGALAGYNTFAQVYNTVNAVSAVPEAFKTVISFFSLKDSNNKTKTLIAIAVVGALLGGVLTTYTIIQRVAKSTAKIRSMEEAFKDLQKEIA